MTREVGIACMTILCAKFIHTTAQTTPGIKLFTKKQTKTRQKSQKSRQQMRSPIASNVNSFMRNETSWTLLQQLLKGLV
jgi:hypothetical protein